MKQELYSNQVNWFYTSIKNRMENLNINKEKGNLSQTDYLNAKSGYMGSINALDIDKTKDIHEQITFNINAFQTGLKQLKVNTIDENDPNLSIFYMLNGGLTYSMLLLTVTDNPQSCCPLNKEIILGKTIENLQNKLKNAGSKESKDIKTELAIVKKQYDEVIKQKNNIVV